MVIAGMEKGLGRGCGILVVGVVGGSVRVERLDFVELGGREDKEDEKKGAGAR